MQADHSLKVSRRDVLAAALRKDLERQDLLVLCIESDEFGVKDEVNHARIQGCYILLQKADNVRICHCHVLKVARVDCNCRFCLVRFHIVVDLTTEPVIFVLACEANVLKAL